MNTPEPILNSKINELIEVLDKDIQYLNQSLAHLDNLRQFVIKRDDRALASLLQTIQTEAAEYAGNETKRRQIRKDLAETLRCSANQLTLSSLARILPQDKKYQLARQKTQLKSLTGKLKNEHKNTSFLLAECARFNRKLLKNIFQLGSRQTKTYTHDGSCQQQNLPAFVNMHF